MTAKEAKELTMKRRSCYEGEAEQVCQAVYADVRKEAAGGKGFCIMPGYDKFPSLDWRLRELIEDRLKSEGYTFISQNESYVDGPLGTISWE